MELDKGKVLVACPTYAGKEFALEPWIAAFNAYQYPAKQCYMVDNTFTDLYFQTLIRRGVKCSHIQPWTDEPMEKTFHRCWELIYEEAEREDCYWIYSVEADNVPAPESLPIMIDVALLSGVHLVTHDYPMHKTAVEASGMKGDEFYYTELGCMLMTRKLLAKALNDYDKFNNIPMSLFATTDLYHGGWCKMTQKFEVKHLDGYEMEFSQYAPATDGWCPTPNVPSDYGTVIPAQLETSGGSIMAQYYPAKRAVENIFYLGLVSRSTGQYQASATLAAGDVKVSKDGGALANLTTLPAVTPAASKMVKVTVSATEMTADNVTLIFSDAAGAEWDDVIVNIQTYTAVDSNMIQIDGLATNGYNATLKLKMLDIENTDDAAVVILTEGSSSALYVSSIMGDGATVYAPAGNGFSIGGLQGLQIIGEAGDGLHISATGGKSIHAPNDIEVSDGDLTLANIEDAVWDASIASHLDAGSTGEKLNDAGAAGNPWSEALPGAYAGGTAGFIVGTNLNATVSSRASQTSLDTLDDYVDTEVAAILADTNELQTDWTNGGRLDLLVDGIKAKTDNLPSDPADASDIAASFTTVNSKLDTIDDYIDTEVAAILAAVDTEVAAILVDTTAIDAKTSQLTFTNPGEVDANIQAVNDTEITGDGSGTPWGPV